MNQESQELSKQQLKSQETKAKIFRAAKHILQKKGYEQLSIKNICEEAGVS
ncbi:TetR/AcrR family transcriptional regulator, partial [Sporofaciens musculi]